MADSTNNIPQLSPSQNDKEVTINELFACASPAMEFARDEDNCDGFVWGFLNNRWNGITGANGTVTLTPSATNYIVVKRSDGVCSVATSATNWNNTIEYARAYKVVTLSDSIDDWEDHRAGNGGVFGPEITIPFAMACSDLGTDLTTGTAIGYLRFPFPFTLTQPPIATLFDDQPSGSILTIDINKNGSSILSTKLTVDNTEFTSDTAATPPVVSGASFAKNDLLTVDIDQVGTSGAKGLQIWLIGVKG